MARILILQEEISWHGVLCRCLSHHELTLVCSADAALSSLRKDEFDLVISRVYLQRENLFHFLKEIKEDPSLARTPVVCFCGLRSRIAALSSNAMARVCKSFGAVGYLSLEDFCHDDEVCDFETLRNAIEGFLPNTNSCG